MMQGASYCGAEGSQTTSSVTLVTCHSSLVSTMPNAWLDLRMKHHEHWPEHIRLLQNLALSMRHCASLPAQEISCNDGSCVTDSRADRSSPSRRATSGRCAPGTDDARLTRNTGRKSAGLK